MSKFASEIYKIGINPVVDPPEEVLDVLFLEAGKSSGPIPVRGKINGAGFTQTLVKYSGTWRLYINGPMLKRSALKVGDVAQIEVEFDPRPREVAMPKQLASALRKNAGARARFQSLSPSRRKEIVRYIGSLKSEESISRNVDRVVRLLTDDQKGEGDRLFGRTIKKSGR